MSKEDIYYQAMQTRDTRFDGKFFVGVKTTGIYCRPICPAKPKRENIEFFNSALDAEKNGYRPCLRCRPESSPKSPAWIGKSAVVQRALKVLNSQETIEFNEDEFAEKFGVSARHLRKLFKDEIGKTPKQIAYENRLNLARKLIVETSLPMSEITYASGFSSIRRFNDAFKERFKKAPREIRRSKIKTPEGIHLKIPYRPPFDYEGLYESYYSHRVGRLEWFENKTMYRLLHYQKDTGYVSIKNNAELSCLEVGIYFPDSSIIHTVITKIRHMFDLDSDPIIVANSLEKQKYLKKLLKSHSGIRLPSGWDAFEISVGTILGQLVSIERGRSLVQDLIDIAGTKTHCALLNQDFMLFPTPEQIIQSDLSSLKTTRQRKQTLIDFSKALIECKLSLEPTQNISIFKENLLKIKGIGPWSAEYISLKALRDTDSFPKNDLILARALEKLSDNKNNTNTLSDQSPWRGYVAALLWKEHASTLKEKSSTLTKKERQVL